MAPSASPSEGSLLSDDRFLRQVARLYYDSDEKQESIAESLNCSRQTISKALQRAKERGIVRTTVVPEERTGYLQSLARDLRLQLHLEDVALIAGQNFEKKPDDYSAEGVLADIADHAADYLDQLLVDNTILAVTGGKGIMRNVVRYLKPSKQLAGLQVVPTMGFVRDHANFGDANLIAYDIATAYGGEHSWLPIPAIVDTPEQLQQARSLPIVRDVLQKVENANVIMMGLWLSDNDESLIRKGVISPERIALLKEHHPVADINHWVFNARGECINYKISPPPYYLTGLEMPRLKERIRNDGTKVILVAGANRRYVPGIKAILNAGIVSILITDHITAQLLKKSTNI